MTGTTSQGQLHRRETGREASRGKTATRGNRTQGGAERPSRHDGEARVSRPRGDGRSRFARQGIASLSPSDAALLDESQHAAANRSNGQLAIASTARRARRCSGRWPKTQSARWGGAARVRVDARRGPVSEAAKLLRDIVGQEFEVSDGVPRVRRGRRDPPDHLHQDPEMRHGRKTPRSPSPATSSTPPRPPNAAPAGGGESGVGPSRRTGAGKRRRERDATFHLVRRDLVRTRQCPRADAQR